MPESRTKIGLKKDSQGRTTITCQDPQSGRVIDTGMKVPEKMVDGEVKKLKEVLERAGNRVSVHDL